MIIEREPILEPEESKEKEIKEIVDKIERVYDGARAIGWQMKGGVVIVERDCGGGIGSKMEGGEIIIKGDCKGYVGKEMKGGKITIKWYCVGSWNASEMRGGKLFFLGGVKGIYLSAFTKNNQGEIRVREEGRIKRIHPIIIPLDELKRR